MKFSTKLTLSHLPPAQSMIAYNSLYMAGIKYVLPITRFYHTQCYKIQSNVFQSLLPKMNLNMHTPRAIIHGPRTHGGIGIPPIYSIQGALQTKLLYQIMRSTSPLQSLLLICQ